MHCSMQPSWRGSQEETPHRAEIGCGWTRAPNWSITRIAAWPSTRRSRHTGPALCWGSVRGDATRFGKVVELVAACPPSRATARPAGARRMSETYGEREGTRRMTNMVIQSQASWAQWSGSRKRAGHSLTTDEHRQRCAYCVADRSCRPPAKCLNKWNGMEWNGMEWGGNTKPAQARKANWFVGELWRYSG